MPATLALRLRPGDDLRQAVEAAFGQLVAGQGLQAACRVPRCAMPASPRARC